MSRYTHLHIVLLVSCVYESYRTNSGRSFEDVAHCIGENKVLLR